MLKFQLYVSVAGLMALMLTSCGSSGSTVIIENAPTGSGTADSTLQSSVENKNFQQLTIGENQPIQTLDPLFAENESELRAIQLMYEGLVRYDENGKIVPAAARKWSISDNSQTYRFSLHSNLYFQDSDIFTNGRGTKVVASDVKRNFERMAKMNVPQRTAQLFMDIRGFEPYYQEQHHVMRKAERQLSGVSGIKTPDDSTIVFHLTQPDEAFLQKLATPYAVIYPPKAAVSNSFKAVGTGPFELSQQRSDSLYIFASFDNYYDAEQVNLNRVDVRTSSSESVLLQSLVDGDIQLIPQLGPGQIQAALSGGSRLADKFATNYRLIEGEGERAYFLRYNTGAAASKQAVKDVLGSVKKERFFPGLPRGSFNLQWALAETSGPPAVDSLTSTHPANPYVKRFYAQLAGKLSDKGVKFVTSPTRVPNRTTPLYVETYLPLVNVYNATSPDNTLLTIEVKSRGMTQNTVQNLQFNHYPWWMNLRGVKVQPTPNSQ